MCAIVQSCIDFFLIQCIGKIWNKLFFGELFHKLTVNIFRLVLASFQFKIELLTLKGLETKNRNWRFANLLHIIVQQLQILLFEETQETRGFSPYPFLIDHLFVFKCVLSSWRECYANILISKRDTFVKFELLLWKSER